MKNSSRLITAIAEHLAVIGYQQLSIRKAASALFFKRHGDVFLTLGVEISGRYKEAFTGSFYLAPTFSWAYAPPDGFPAKAFRRIGECLSPSQRKAIEPGATAKQVDVWWYGFTPANTRQFADFVKVAEPKFLNDKALVESVRKCTAIRDRLRMLDAVRHAFEQHSLVDRKLVEQVKMDKGVPVEWYLAAAKVAREQFPECNQKHGIKMLAEESWLLSEFGSA
jgi:hypothetical protein